MAFSRMESFFATVASYVEWDFKSLLLFVAVFIITADYIKNRRPAGFPPGPPALPIVGNMFTLDMNRTHESLMQVYPQKTRNVNVELIFIAIFINYVLCLQFSSSWLRNMGMCTAYGLVRSGP